MPAPSRNDPTRADGHAALGRADLLRAYLELGLEEATSLARRLGYVERRAPARREVPVSTAPPEAPLPKVTGAPENFEPVPTWRQEKVSDRPSDEDLRWIEDPAESGGLAPEDLGRRTAPEPEAPPIVAWPRLRRILDQVLRGARKSRALDVDRLVEGWSRGRVFHDLPRRSALGAARIGMILDDSRRLVPFWDDQLRLVTRWVEREGLDRVRLIPPPGTATRRRAPSVSADDEIVLALSDLGAYGDEGARSAWKRFGRRVRDHGAEIRALSPCPARRWPGQAEKIWRAIDWERPRLGSSSREASEPVGREEEHSAELLLAAISPAVRVEPGLLRAIRQVLERHGEPAGIDAEVEVWRHPHVNASSTRSLAVELDRAALWQERFAGLPAELRDEVARTILSWHRGLPRDIRCLEILHLLAAGVPRELIGEEQVDRALAIFAGAAASFEAGGELADEIEPWTARLLRRAPSAAPTLSGFRPHLARLGRVLRRRTGELQASGVTPEMLFDGDSGSPPRRWRLWQVGDRLELRQPEAGGVGSPLVEIVVRDELTVSGPGSASVPFKMGSETPAARLPEAGGPILLTSDFEDLRLEPFERPRWASAAGRDRFGLWAAISVEDDAGNEVRHRLRWISPGRFLMGSPEDEEGRFDDEGPRHEVVITRGFWLGETTCTQDLWQAVMGENRSKFRSSRRPVENVSWEDTEPFFERLADRSGGFVARLPSEAEWEYACRAGTHTATYAGDLEIRGERNARVLDAISWYGGNSGVDFDLEEGRDSTGWSETQYDFEKAGTRTVAAKRPNGWGLYDMLGNVWEWCADGWADRYDVASVPRVNPVASGDGSYRVIRGGSWNDGARSVRAAYRYWIPASVRGSYLGFRLARGQREAELGSRAAARRSGVPARQGERRTGSADGGP